MDTQENTHTTHTRQSTKQGDECASATQTHDTQSHSSKVCLDSSSADTTTKQNHIIDMFNQIAKDYDKANRILSLGIDISWRIDAIKRAYSACGERGIARIVDVACGSGDMMKYWVLQARKLHKQLGEVIGVDPSSEMIKLAQKKLAALLDSTALESASLESTSPQLESNARDYIGATQDSTHSQSFCNSTQDKGADIAGVDSSPSARFILSQAKDLSQIPSQSVDMLSISYGLRNVLEYELALREFARVLKPNGVLVVLDFFKKPNPSLLDKCIGLYTKHILPYIGYLVSKNYAAYKYLPDSMEEFISPNELAQSLQSVGITPIEIRSYSAGISHLVLGKKLLDRNVPQAT